MDCTPVFKNAKIAGRQLLNLDKDLVNKVLLAVAAEIEANTQVILTANEKDLALVDKTVPLLDRLRLTSSRIENIVSDIRNVAAMPSPSGRVISEYKKPNGLLISKITVPFGVIGVIYEARPNVTPDVFSLCFKSGNACILKGGTDAINSNLAFVNLIRETLKKHGINQDIINLLPPGRDDTIQLLNARNYVDLIIPRGSQDLINYVRDNARIPVIETGAGICHTYFDKAGDPLKGRSVIVNAKTRRVSVCNALDCLIVHESRLDTLFYLVEPCAGHEVIIYADNKAYNALRGKYPDSLLEKATDESFGTEFLSYKMSIKTAGTFQEALDHIAEHSSGHSEAIISEDKSNLEAFCSIVDAAAVYTNASTAFTDGAEFGLGAEIGISTQKLHARGPMALEALNTFKWIIRGDGQIRP